MPKIIVWKCSHTGKLFEDEKKYKNHLAKLAIERRITRRLDVVRQEHEEQWNKIHETEMSLSELPQFIIDNQAIFWKDAKNYNCSFGTDWGHIGKKTRNGVIMPIPEIVSFDEFKLTWDDSVSNTHSCPHNGVTNWGGRVKDAPRGYPGWRGSVKYQIRWPEEFAGCYPGSDLFNGRYCRVHNAGGSGGGWQNGFQHFQYAIELFAADWPGLVRYREKMLMWKKLGGTVEHY